MIAAFDVQYYDEYAKSVGLCFEDWLDAEPLKILEKKVLGVAAYQPGEFYKRELPCILAVLEEIGLEGLEMIIIDGYVHLDDEERLGLGGHLYQELGGKIPIIGVAKTRFHDNEKNVAELLRGESTRPLFITAIGIEKEKAHDLIHSMLGKFRMPTLLQILDTKTKEKDVSG